MNRHENLERDLMMWFADTATPRVPDFTDDILRLTAGSRQRPRWSFPERWLPMSVLTLGRRTLRPLPWRTIGLLAALALLIAAAVAVLRRVAAQAAGTVRPGRHRACGVQRRATSTCRSATGARPRSSPGPGPTAMRVFSLMARDSRSCGTVGGGNQLLVVDPPEVGLGADHGPRRPDVRPVVVARRSSPLLHGRSCPGARRRRGRDAAACLRHPVPGFPTFRPPDGRQLVYCPRIDDSGRAGTSSTGTGNRSRRSRAAG